MHARLQRTKTEPKTSKLSYFIAGVLAYILLTMAVLYWYEDDVEQMSWADREVFNHKVISQYSANSNMTQDQVLARLGSPDITEALQQNNAVYQLLYYRTHRVAADGITTPDECTALLFKNRRLIAIGNAAVTQYKAIASNAG